MSTKQPDPGRWPDFANPLGLTDLEIAFGGALGVEEPRRAEQADHPSPMAAFEAALRSSVTRPPCVVMFSGGRDSSAVLAVATRVARSLGVPDPLPVSVLFNADEAAEESEWQELLIRHLGIREWVRVPVDDELDLVGSRARRILTTHGLLAPAHVNLYDLGLEHAQGGSLMSGLQGDHVFTPLPSMERVRSVLYRRERPAPRDLLRIGLSFSPRRVREAVWTRRMARSVPRWIVGPQARDIRRTLVSNNANRTRNWGESVVQLTGRRSAILARASLGILAQERDASVAAPIGDPAFLTALAVHGGRAGFRSRTHAMEQVFAEELPAALLARKSKARFRWSYWGSEAREFAETWDGRGLPEFVDAEILRNTWLQIADHTTTLPAHAGLAALPLHAAWLSRSEN